MAVVRLSVLSFVCKRTPTRMNLTSAVREVLTGKKFKAVVKFTGRGLGKGTVVTLKVWPRQARPTMIGIVGKVKRSLDLNEVVTTPSSATTLSYHDSLATTLSYHDSLATTLSIREPSLARTLSIPSTASVGRRVSVSSSDKTISIREDSPASTIAMEYGEYLRSELECLKAEAAELCKRIATICDISLRVI